MQVPYSIQKLLDRKRFRRDPIQKRGVVTPAVAVAKAFGQLHASVGFPDYELLLSRCYRRFLSPGQVVFDVGCHTGAHLEQFLELIGASGRAVGFEPIPSLADRLIRKYADRRNVEIRCLALADRSYRSEFFILHDALGMSGFKWRPDSGDEKPERIDVQVDTLDRQAAELSRVDYIKIDVEGAEISCLRGARLTVARHRPFISVEYGMPSYSLFGHTAMTLFEWARDNGYVLSDLFGNLIDSGEEWAVVCDYSLWDFFLVPKERRGQWESLF